MASQPLSTLPAGYRLDPLFGAVYDAIPDSADDLTLIRSIETREAAGLNRLGIYFFEQMAAWTDDQTAAVADALGMPVSAMIQGNWRSQAQMLCQSTLTPEDRKIDQRQRRSAPPLPASGTRTILLLVCALLIGCFVVTWLNRRSNLPMSGVLAAEVTSLRVPADARLLATHVSAGDEVFTGEVLLTLEKTEHLEQIAGQQQKVRHLTTELQKAEAQADVELKWRRQQLQQELSDTRRRVRYFNSIWQQSDDPRDVSDSSPSRLFRTASHPHQVLPPRAPRVNGLLFISGRSGRHTLDQLPAPPQRVTPQVTAMRPSPTATSDAPADLIRMEADHLKARLQQLEQLQTHLPAQIRMAAGVEHLRIQLQDAGERLAHMKSLNRETAVLCPGYGTVGQLCFAEGDRMARGDIMLRILHTDRCYVIVHVPAERIAEVQPGTGVTVMFPDHDRCEGVVANVPMIADRQLTNGVSVAAVRVESTGRHWPELPIGSRVQVVAQ